MCSHVLDETLYKPRSMKCVPMFWMRLYINQGPRNVFPCFGGNFIWTKVHEMCSHVLDETLYKPRSTKCVPMFWMKLYMNQGPWNVFLFWMKLYMHQGPSNVCPCFGWDFIWSKVPKMCSHVLDGSPKCGPMFWMKLYVNQGSPCICMSHMWAHVLAETTHKPRSPVCIHMQKDHICMLQTL